MTTGMAAGVFFGLAFVYFLPALVPGQGLFGTDYLAGSYPFFEFMAERFRSLSLPMWVPHVYGGVPLFASPGSGFYPIWLLLAMVLPLSAVLPMLFAVQLGLAGIGMYLLVRELDGRPWVAFLCGLAYQFTGIIASTVYGGHDGRAIVATLAPLFLFFLHRTVRTGRLAPAVGAATTLAFCLLSFQIQSSYYLLLAGLAWGIFCLVAFRVRGRDLIGRLALSFGAVLVAFALGSVNFLPFLDYVEASPRGGEEGRGYEYAVSWSMPPSELSALAVPEWEGASVRDPNTGEAQFPDYRGENPFKLHTEYVGAFVLLLLALGVWYGRRDRYWWFFLALAVFALTISFGGHTPIYRLYFELLPGTKRFRAPSISFYLAALSLVVMAGLTLERLAGLHDTAGRTRGGGRARPPSGAAGTDSLDAARWVALGAVALAILFLVAGAAGGDPGRGAGFARFGVFLAFSAGAIWVWLSGRVSTQVAVAALALITVADLWIIGRRFFHTVPPPQVWFQADDVVHALSTAPASGRVWVLPVGQQYRGTGNYLMSHGIVQAGGEHPNPLQRWYEFVGEGEGHYVDWHNFLGQTPAFRHASNIRWIVSMVQLEGAPQFAGVRLVHRGPSALIYEDPGALPRAYLVGSATVMDDARETLAAMADPAFDPRVEAILHSPAPLELGGGQVVGDARIVDWSPDVIRLTVNTDRPALLVLAENYYPGWRAELNGGATPVIRANHTLRAVAVPAGDHEVVLRFRPTRFLIGFWIYAIGLLLLTGYGALLAHAHWRRARATVA
jgi:hypothetical protein